MFISAAVDSQRIFKSLNETFFNQIKGDPWATVVEGESEIVAGFQQNSTTFNRNDRQSRKAIFVVIGIWSGQRMDIHGPPGPHF